MAITPPPQRIWWKEPIAKIELTWIIIAFTWGLIMFFMMIYWHGAGEQNLSNEAYKISPEKFAERSQAMIDGIIVLSTVYFTLLNAQGFFSTIDAVFMITLLAIMGVTYDQMGMYRAAPRRIEARAYRQFAQACPVGQLFVIR